MRLKIGDFISPRNRKWYGWSIGRVIKITKIPHQGWVETKIFFDIAKVDYFSVCTPDQIRRIHPDKGRAMWALAELEK